MKHVMLKSASKGPPHYSSITSTAHSWSNSMFPSRMGESSFDIRFCYSVGPVLQVLGQIGRPC